MSVESDADRASFCAADEFGAEVAWSVGGVAVPVFTAQFFNGASDEALGEDGGDIVNRQATLLFPERLLPAGADQGEDDIAIGGIHYVVKSVHRDGTGMVMVRLEELLS